MSYLKHNNNGNKSEQPRSAKKPEAVVVTGPDTGHMSSPSLQHDINHVAGLADIETSLDWIAQGLSKLTSDEHCIHLTTGYNTDPVKVTLSLDSYDSDDVMGRLVTAVERIADSLARLAGLSRPRLESWHEQDEYEPRNKDGGTPGPKTA